MSEDYALAQSSDVAIVTIITSGRHEAGAVSVEEYENVKVRVERILKGDVVGDVLCRYKRFDFSSSTPEIEPAVGESYITFLQCREEYRGKKLYNAIRFVECSGAKLEEIQKKVAPKPLR